MRTVTVYRMDYGRRTNCPIGVVLENRKTERTINYNDLLRLARRLFANDTADGVCVGCSQPSEKCTCKKK